MKTIRNDCRTCEKMIFNIPKKEYRLYLALGYMIVCKYCPECGKKKVIGRRDKQ